MSATGKLTRLSEPDRDVLAAQMAAKVDASAGPETCWPWTGSYSRGYGKARVRAGGQLVQMYASRAAYLAAHGEIGEDMFVLHSCDNPPCCNPRHLRPGTHQENMDDRKRRGRYPRGNANPIAQVIPDETVAEIRATYRPWSKQFGQPALAARFGLSRWTVQEIVTRTGRWDDARKARAAMPHLALVVSERPEWCGSCNEFTRLTEPDDGPSRRCTACHPLALEAS